LLLLATPRHPHADLLGPAESLGVGSTAHPVGVHEALLAASLTNAQKEATTVVSTDGDIHQGLLHGHHLISSLALLLGLVGSLTRETNLRDISWSLHVHHLLLLRELHLHGKLLSLPACELPLVLLSYDRSLVGLSHFCLNSTSASASANLRSLQAQAHIHGLLRVEGGLIPCHLVASAHSHVRYGGITHVASPKVVVVHSSSSHHSD
jgi:hypothetical protein